jgi:hypothetical protein
MPVERTAVRNCPSNRGSRDWMTRYRSSKDIDVMVSRTGAALLMSPSPTRPADTGWRKADTTVKASARGGP